MIRVGPMVAKPSDRLYVQFGCGWCAPTTWRNFDASLTLRWERMPLVGRVYTKNRARFPANVEYGDVTKGLPVAPNSCDGVYASHVLEHLCLADFRVALANTLSYLKPGGIFRLVVPDMERLCRDYLQSLEAGDPEACMRLVESTGLGRAERPRGFIGRLARAWGRAAHQWMWDAAAVSRELEKAGFVRRRRCQYNDCEDPAFQDVEDPARFEGCLAIECRKPLPAG
jgi:hypothetical protein